MILAIQVNGEHKECQATTLASLLSELGYQDAVVATAHNGQFIPQAQRADCTLHNGDKIEILAPMQGG